MFSPLFTARGPNEQAKVSAGLRAVQNEQPNERQCSSSPPFRGVNTERAGRTRDNIGKIRERRADKSSKVLSPKAVAPGSRAFFTGSGLCFIGLNSDKENPKCDLFW